MDIEKVKLIKTLKMGERVYLEGEVHTSPKIDDVLLEEVRLVTGTVKVLSRRERPTLKIVKRQPIEEGETASTFVGTTSNLFNEDKKLPAPFETKAKPKLVKRKVK